MGLRANSPLLFVAGLVVSGAAAVVIGWGRIRDVHVPSVGHWEEVARVCPGHGVSTPDLAEAIAWWTAHGHPLVLTCEHWTVSVDLDPALDTRDSVEDVGTTHGSTVLHTDEATIVAAEVRVLPGSDALVMAHELGHVLGFMHPRNTPTGHILHPHHPGWDSRGVQ